LLKAVIFDMDGVIIDSEPMHARAAILALKKFNIDITMEYLNHFIGTTTPLMCRRIVEDFKINTSCEELLKANDEMKAYLLNTEGHTVIPYITELMKDLHSNGIKLSIASSSPIHAIEEVMVSLNIEQYFDGFVSGAMVAHPKPAPDVFLEAARRLGVKPEECVVIEDSFHGVTAAEAAGMTCIGFVNPNSGNQDLSKAAILVEGFDEVDYSFVNQVYQYSHNEPVTVLTTEHFIIRELTVEDIDAMYQICQTPEIICFMEDSEDSLTVQREKHKAYIENMYHFYGFGLWGVFMKENNSLVGRCGIELKMQDDEEIYELGYLLNKPYQGQGLAKEFVTAVINYCFTRLHIERIVAIIDKSNTNSIYLAKKVGMQLYGECMRSHHTCNKYEIKNYVF
jgi:beta-phosphoglucomutase family hydrolase